MTNSESRRNLQTATPIERFLHWVFLRDSDLGVWVYQKQGITLLLVVVLLSAILSISIGIFNVVYGEFRISGEVADSFRALYAADEGIAHPLSRSAGQCDLYGDS